MQNWASIRRTCSLVVNPVVSLRFSEEDALSRLGILVLTYANKRQGPIMLVTLSTTLVLVILCVVLHYEAMRMLRRAGNWLHRHDAWHCIDAMPGIAFICRSWCAAC